MRTLLQAIDEFLRGRDVFAVDAPLAHRLRGLMVLLVARGIFYGAVMGTYSGLAPSRHHQLLYSGVIYHVLHERHRVRMPPRRNL